MKSKEAPLNERTFTFEEVKQIADDIMNLGMMLRQDQLNGFDRRSGNEVLQEYFDDLDGEKKILPPKR